MPITAKLSRGFYDRFGDEIVNELVEWLNAVDQGYRQEFRDLFDARFSLLEGRLAAAEQRFGARLEALEQRVEAQLGALEQRFELRLAQVQAEFRGELKQEVGRLEAAIARSEARIIAWCLGFSLAQVGAMFGLLKAAGVL